MAKYLFYISGTLAVGGVYALDVIQARHAMQVLHLNRIHNKNLGFKL